MGRSRFAETLVSKLTQKGHLQINRDSDTNSLMSGLETKRQMSDLMLIIQVKDCNVLRPSTLKHKSHEAIILI